MKRIDASPLNYPPNSSSPINRWRHTKAPTSNDFKNFDVGDEVLDESSNIWWKLSQKFADSGIWAKLGGVAGQVDSLQGDTGGIVPPDGSNNIKLLGAAGGMSFVGIPASNEIEAKNLRNIGRYVVDASGDAEYTTIQSAINAANTAGGGTVYVRPGIYTENLTCYANVNIRGTNFSSFAVGIVIKGTHTLPTTGVLNISGVVLEPTSGSNAFQSNAAGSATLEFETCVSHVDLGYFVYVPNWVGLVKFLRCTGGELVTYRDSVFYNASTCSLLVDKCSLGYGIGTAPLTCRGPNFSFPSPPSQLFSNSIIYCPVNFTGSALMTSGMVAWVNNVTFSDASLGNIGTGIISPFVIGASGNGIVFNTSGTVAMSQNLIGVLGAAAIAGTGSGTLYLNGVDFTFDSTVPAGINISYGGASWLGPIRTTNISFDRGVTQLSSNGQLIIGRTGLNPAIGTLTAGAGISITNGSGSITIAASGAGLAWTNISSSQGMVSGNGYACTSGGALVLTLPATAAVGATFEALLDGSTSWQIAQNSGQQCRIGNVQTTSGVGGSITSTAQGDWIQIVCVTANTKFVVHPKQGNFTVV